MQIARSCRVAVLQVGTFREDMKYFRWDVEEEEQQAGNTSQRQPKAPRSPRPAGTDEG